MNRKAQVTIEYIVIIGIFIVLFAGVTLPMAFKASSASRDVELVVEMKDNLNKISSAIEIVNAQGYGSVRTVEITSSRNSWGLVAYPGYINKTLAYFVVFDSGSEVPPEISTSKSNYGAIGVDIDGVYKNSLNSSYIILNETGRWKVLVRNNNFNSAEGVIYIRKTIVNGDTIVININSQ